MPDERPPPARPWFDLVVEEMNIRGWGIAELARYAGVSRPTIYGWRDNLSKPRPRPVNDVADKLGIDRRRALRLAGIVAAAPGPDTADGPRDEHERLILANPRMSEADKEQMIDSYRRAVRKTGRSLGHRDEAGESPG